MRRVIVCNIMSIDGFYAAADGNPLVLNMDEAFDAYNRERIEAADVVLLGRSSFEGFSAYWPYVADAPEDPDNRALSVDNRATSRAYNMIPKVVVSDSLHVLRDNPWYGTTTVISRWGAGAWITEAREKGTADRAGCSWSYACLVGVQRPQHPSGYLALTESVPAEEAVVCTDGFFDKSLVCFRNRR